MDSSNRSPLRREEQRDTEPNTNMFFFVNSDGKTVYGFSAARCSCCAGRKHHSPGKRTKLDGAGGSIAPPETERQVAPPSPRCDVVRTDLSPQANASVPKECPLDHFNAPEGNRFCTFCGVPVTHRGEGRCGSSRACCGTFGNGKRFEAALLDQQIKEFNLHQCCCCAPLTCRYCLEHATHYKRGGCIRKSCSSNNYLTYGMGGWLKTPAWS
jgi:hypothetical protein